MWKVISEFPAYEASDEGKIRHIKNQRELKPTPTTLGYMRVNLRKDNQSYSRYVHRIIAETFLEGEAQKEVNHIDGDKSNNKLSNLEWITHSENVKHSFDNLGRQSESTTKKKIKVTYLNGEIKYFDSVKECAEYYGVERKTIRSYIEFNLSDRRKIQANFEYI